MEFTIKIPTIAQLSHFAVWDASVGVFLAIVLAGLVGAYFILSLVMSGFMGGHRINGTWMFMNIVVGLFLSLATLSLSGSWLAGCAMAIVCFFVLSTMRVKLGG